MNGKQKYTFPASFAQRRMWFLDQLDPGSATYNIPSVQRLRGPLNVEVLEKSLNEIVRRHEILRTRFEALEGDPMQVVEAEASFQLKVEVEDAVDRSTGSETEIEQFIEEQAAQQRQIPFNLAQCPLMRVKLVRLAAEDHVLLLTMHHIISDGWSLSLLYGELAEIYVAYSAGQPSPLPELAIQYADFSLWQQEWMQGEVLEEQLSYWRKQLAGMPPVHSLATDFPRPAMQSHQGDSVRFVLGPELTQGLKSLSRKQNATLFMALLTAFQILLHRYSGQEDVVVGTPIAGRNREEIEPLIGFFVNTLVLRTKLNGNPRFQELLEQVKEDSLGAYAHQDVPFEKLVEGLHIERSLSHAPLFQVLFVLLNVPEKAVEFNGLQMKEIAVSSKLAKFDLTLILKEDEGELHGELEYTRDLFGAETIKRIVGHFQTLLEGIVADPTQRVGELPLLSAAERQQLLVEFNDREADYDEFRSTIQQLFEAQVARTPEATALVCEDRELTYRELNRRANQVAHYLRKQGVGPEAVVGVLLERSLEMVVSLLGVLKAGAAYLPLDPAYPAARLNFMLADAQVRVLLTQQRLVERLGETETSFICIEVGDEAIGEESVENPISNTGADNLAYIIYTSGSTGKPKGAMILHGAVCNLLMALDQIVYSQPDRTHLRVSLNGPIAFDTSVKQLIQLLKGNTLCILPEEVRRDPEAFVNYLDLNPLDVLDCTPYMLRLLIGAGLLDRPEILPKVVLIGGEPIEESLWQTLTQNAQTDFYNVYGPTECTVNTTTCRVREHPAQPLIGNPITNSEVYLLDQYLQPVPVGVNGELYIGGEGLARGYWQQRELTADRFVPHPYSERAGRRLYRTGDIGRYQADGQIEFLGRRDEQVKLRGFRVELGEIEAALSGYPGIREQVVIVREDEPGDQRLVAYIVSEAEPQPGASELRQYLQAKLPDYMVPTAFVHLETLPLTPNGKVDRKALPASQQYQTDQGANYVPPRNSTEVTVAGIWSEVLKVEPIGIHDNFFDLGGHSLLATQVISKVRRSFQLEIPLRRLFVDLTVAALSDSITQALSVGSASRPAPISRISREQYSSI